MAYGGSINTDIMSDETFDRLCRICKRKGKNREAEKYCIECNDYFCLNCVTVHEDIPTLTGHKILDKPQFPSICIKAQYTGKPGSSSKLRPPAPTEKCEQHSHHYIDMYCQTHDDVGCGTCMAVDHRLCQDIFYIPEFLQKNPSTSNTKDIQQSIGSTFTTIKVQSERLAREKQNLLTSKARSLEKIRNFRKEINDRLDELEQSTMTVIEDEYKILLNKIEEEIKLLDKQKAEVTSARNKLAVPANNISQDFVNAKKGKHINICAAKCLKEKQALSKINDKDFSFDQRILALLQEINVLGEMREICTEATGVNEYREKQTEIKKKTAASISEKKGSLLQVKGSKKYSVKVKSDKSFCFIASACTMEDGTIILSDWQNNKLKRFDSSRFTVTDCCDLPGLPWQVCPISRHQVAVSLPYNQQVNFITVSNTMTITNMITTDFSCRGLAYAGGNLYISDSLTSVYVYSVSGKKLKQFSKDQSGQAMFSNICCLAVNDDGSRIYVTDLANGLIVLDSNGQVVGKSNSSLLSEAYGSYLTASGSLLVCGLGSKNVLQFGLNGELIGEVVKTGYQNRAICCNQQMTKMIISRNDQLKNDKIEVYDLA